MERGRRKHVIFYFFYCVNVFHVLFHVLAPKCSLRQELVSFPELRERQHVSPWALPRSRSPGAKKKKSTPPNIS